MIKLQTQFVAEDNQFTQVKRSDKAALYKRETLEGNFVSYEVFPIMTKNGKEIYPEKHAFSKWAWCPISEDRATVYFNRLENDEIVIPQVDPETSEMIRDENEQTYEELMAEADEIVAQVEIPVNVEVVPEVEIPVDVVVEEDPTIPASMENVVETPTVDVTPDGGTVVTVAKVEKTVVTMVIPTGEFTQAQFAVANGLPERGIVWSKLDKLVKDGKITKSFKKLGRGRTSAVFVGV